MYAQKKKSKENTPRSAVNVFTQKKNEVMGSSFVDYRAEAIAQRKMINVIQYNSQRNLATAQFNEENNSKEKQYVKQLYKVPDDHIRADLRHKDSGRLFRDYTIEDIEERLGGKISMAFSNAQVEQAVSESRDNDMMDYSQLSTRKVSSEKQITSFLNVRPDDEHMYVLDNDEHHVAIRSESVKLPHPTLVGGDPDVDCAGTMRLGIDGAVIVDDGSGHFRPGGAKPAEQKLNKIMNKTAKKNFKKKIKKGKRL